MLLVLLLFATFGGCRQRAEAVKGERWVVLTAACNTAIHKMWHSCWRDTAVSLFYSVIKTTSVRVHLLVTGSVGQSHRANLLYAGDRIGSAARVPRARVSRLSPGGVTAAETLCTARVTQSLILRGAGWDIIIKPLWKPVSTTLPPGLKGKTHCAFQSQGFRNRNQPFNCIFHLGM